MCWLIIKLVWQGAKLMNTNLDAILRIHIPVHMQGRVYSVRNSLQFFTIPLGYLFGGFLVDSVFEPLMEVQDKNSLPLSLARLQCCHTCFQSILLPAQYFDEIPHLR